jgi:ribosome biogenesis GTPase A
MGGSIGKKKSKIIIVGLDNSGKSTMINMLKPKKVILLWFYIIVCGDRDSSNSRLQS